MNERLGNDCYSPKEIAERVETIGVAKANLPLLSQVVLGILAGGFIALGAIGFTVVASDNLLSFAIGRFLGGLVFSLGLILVVVAGAELFTGNNLLIMSAVGGRISASLFIRNMAIVYAANFAGATGLAGIVAISGHSRMGASAVGRTALRIASEKCAIPFGEAFVKGILCNLLVCLAVWLALAGRSVSDKIAAVVFPVTTFVACGFEHSVANMYFIPAGIFLSLLGDRSLPAELPAPTWLGLLQNLVPVTLGNLVGGAGLVGLVYWIVYRRHPGHSSPERPG